MRLKQQVVQSGRVHCKIWLCKIRNGVYEENCLYADK